MSRTPEEVKNDLIKDKKEGKEAGMDNSNKKTGKKPGSKHHRRGNPVRQDPFWYAKTQEAIDRLGRIPFNTIAGGRLLPGDSCLDATPSALVVPIIHCINTSALNDDNDYAKRAADAYFQYICQGYIGNIDTFEAPDLLFTALSGAEVFALIEEARRAINVMRIYLPQNKAYAQHMTKALGFDYDSFVKGDYSLADFVADLNVRVQQINTTIAVPKDFTIMQRWVYLAKYMFSDNNQAEFNTLSFYRMAAALQYSGTASQYGTSLVIKPLYNELQPGDRLFTPRSFLQALDSLIAPLNGEDPRMMFAALRRVYSDDQFYKVPEFTMQLESPIVRNDIVSCELHNGSYFWGAAFRDDTHNLVNARVDGAVAIFQKDGNIICRPHGALMDASITIAPPEEHLVDTWAIDPTAGNVLDMIAPITPSYVTASNKGDKYKPIFPLSEISLFPALWSFSYSEDVADLEYFGPSVIQVNRVNSSMSLADAQFTHINSAPFINYYEYSANHGCYVLRYFIGEVDKYTTVSSNVLSRMHARAAYEMLSMPRNTKSLTK